MIRVGYEDGRYAVRERSGTVELCVVTRNLVPSDRTFVLRATLQNNMAGMFMSVYEYCVLCIPRMPCSCQVGRCL